MTQGAALTATIARQLRELRDARGWSGQRLAQEMNDQGIAWDRSVVANLETGRRRTVSVDEWLALARVLGVAPMHLLVPVDDAGEVFVTPRTALPAADARAWIRGYRALDGDSTWYYRHRPPEPSDDDVRDRLVKVEQTVVSVVNAMNERFPEGIAVLQEPGQPLQRIDREGGDGEHQASS